MSNTRVHIVLLGSSGSKEVKSTRMIVVCDNHDILAQKIDSILGNIFDTSSIHMKIMNTFSLSH